MADHPPSVVHGEILADRDTLGLPDVEQLELIRDQLPGRDPGAAVIAHRRQGRGRPPGAMNKANRKFRDYILSQHSHPGLALARTYDRPTELLAAELGCSLFEAATLQTRAATELLPYLEGKAPISVELKRRNDVVLIMPGANVSDDQLEAIRSAVDDAEEIDWSSAEAGDVLSLTSFSGGPQQDVQSEDPAQRES